MYSIRWRHFANSRFQSRLRASELEFSWQDMCISLKKSCCIRTVRDTTYLHVVCWPLCNTSYGYVTYSTSEQFPVDYLLLDSTNVISWKTQEKTHPSMEDVCRWFSLKMCHSFLWPNALVAVCYSPGFAIGKLQVRISAGDTSHQGLLSLPSLRGR